MPQAVACLVPLGFLDGFVDVVDDVCVADAPALVLLGLFLLGFLFPETAATGAAWTGCSALAADTAATAGLGSGALF